MRLLLVGSWVAPSADTGAVRPGGDGVDP